MADDITLPGTGKDVASDEIASKHYQRIKLVHGIDGVNDGDVAVTNPFPVVGNVTFEQQLALLDKCLLTRPVTEVNLDLARIHITGQRTFFLFGFNNNVGTSFVDIHPNGGNVNWLTVGGKVAVSSSNAADTAAGLGCQSVELHGLSLTGADQDEVIALNGLTEVESTLDYVRVNLMHNQEVGTYGGSHQGDITCRVASGGAKTGTLLSMMTGVEGAVDSSVQYGSGESGNGYTSIPLGKVAYLRRGFININTTGTKTADVVLYEREGILNVTTPFDPRRILYSGIEVQGVVPFQLDSLRKIKNLTDIFFRAKASNINTKISVGLEYYLLDEDAFGA